MAHEIEQFADGTAAFAGRNPAWHTLGIVTREAMSIEEVIEKAILNWQVTLEPVTVTFPDGSFQVIAGKFATVRNHPKLGYQALDIVGKRYTPIQNLDSMRICQDFVDVGGACFETAGSLFGGRRIFVSLKVPREIGTKYGDKVESYLVVMNSHDGSSCLEALVTTVEVVCCNTLAMAFNEAKRTGSRFRIRHTSNASTRLEEAREALGLTFRYLDQVEATMDAMIEQKFWEAEFEAMVKELMPIPQEIKSDETIMHIERERDKLLYLRENGVNKEFIDTAWGAYGAVTEYADWYAPIRAKNHDERRAENVLTGAQDQFKNKALYLIQNRAA